MTIDELIERVLELDAKATPGPWAKISDSYPPMLWDASGEAIVSRMPDGRPYFEPPDANLIAIYRSAAPELARELRETRVLAQNLAGELEEMRNEKRARIRRKWRKM